MKIVDTVVQGTTITFNASFFDNSGANVIPASANLVVSFYTNATPTSNTLSMSFANSVWSAVWQSSVADLGVVNYEAIAAGGANNISATKGSFRLV